VAHGNTIKINLHALPAQQSSCAAGRNSSPSCTTGCPVILPSEAWPVWLGEEPADTERLKALLAPYPAEGMTTWQVDKRVGNVKNNDPSLVEPVAGLLC